MNLKKLLMLPLAAVLAVCPGCSQTEVTDDQMTTTGEATVKIADTNNNLTPVDNTKWNYNEEDAVYWKVQIQYCSNPADLQYETLGIFVPAVYMNASDNGDGTYTCEINPDSSIGNYTAANAPIVIPVDTPGYAAMDAPTDYVSSASSYTDAGFIYVNAGCRGRDAGAPAGVTDLKAAIRYLRYNGENLPGSTDRIFTFGMSGGGAQSALMGATGDSELYTPYLEAIGAAENVSDAVAGSMCWCPITNLDYANEAYEWNLGSTRSGLDSETQTLSDNMASAFAEYINAIGLTDTEGNVLTLTESEDGIYQSGSYYDYTKEVIEQSLNHFLADTTFPYTTGGTGKGEIPDGIGNDGFEGRGGGKGDGTKNDGTLPELEDGDTLPDKDSLPDGNNGPKREIPDDMGELPDKDTTGLDMDTDNTNGYIDENGEFQDDGIQRNDIDNNLSESKTYETAQEYIDDLNAGGEWITYDSSTNTATVTSVEAFVAKCKNASKNVGAFDDLSKTQGENILFGYGDGEGAHFDSIMAALLKGTDYEESFTEDLAKTDDQGNTAETRLNMYNPMYYLSDYYDGYQTSNVAKFWRIRTGINQSDTALSTEINLALALQNYGDTDVDFETVWGQGHTQAERTGDSTTNFIEWVNECLKNE